MASLLYWSVFLITVLVRYGSTGKLMKFFSLILNNAVAISFTFYTSDTEMSTYLLFEIKRNYIRIILHSYVNL